MSHHLSISSPKFIRRHTVTQDHEDHVNGGLGHRCAEKKIYKKITDFSKLNMLLRNTHSS